MSRDELVAIYLRRARDYERLALAAAREAQMWEEFAREIFEKNSEFTNSGM